jgi:hypothetical protein
MPVVKAGKGATQAGVIWVKPPDGLARAVEEYGRKALDAVYAVAQFIAQKMQDESRQNAPWQDRTGNARTGLFGTVDKGDRNSAGQFISLSEQIVTIYLSHGHTVFYGKFLELAHGGKYAIIMPTIEKNLPELKRLLDSLFR